MAFHEDQLCKHQRMLKLGWLATALPLIPAILARLIPTISHTISTWMDFMACGLAMLIP